MGSRPMVRKVWRSLHAESTAEAHDAVGRVVGAAQTAYAANRDALTGTLAPEQAVQVLADLRHVAALVDEAMVAVVLAGLDAHPVRITYSQLGEGLGIHRTNVGRSSWMKRALALRDKG